MYTFTKGDLFPSWKALSEAVEIYQRDHHVQLWRRDSRKLETAVKRYTKRSFNSELEYFDVSWNCIHGGRIHKSRSGGDRPNTSTYRQACPFTMKFRATKDGQQLELVNFEDCHTHEISAASYEHYPRQRQLDDDTKTEVAKMLKVGANRKLLQRHVSEKTGKRVLMRDIHNLGYRSKSRPTTSQSEVTALADHLKTYPGLSSEFVIQDGSVAGIYLQDTDMAKTFSAYPELMLVDSTHKVNSLRMPLFLILVVDGNGESEVVAAFIVINECADLLSQMVTIFKTRNPAWESINVIMTDKDLAERKVFKDLLPQANLHICLFHVMRTFKREISTEKMGITQEERTTALEIIQDICYAKSEEQYQKR